MNCDRINELYAGQIYGHDTQLAARDRIHWICSQVQGETILDIGCSQGIVCLLLGREGFNCVGIDIENGAIEYAKGELEKQEDITKQRITFQVADATRLEFEDNTFDTIILGEILEHLLHPEKVLKEAKRVLKEAGKVVITVPFGLNSHPDHKRSYFPVSFVNTVRPFFKTTSISTLHNYIVYCGKKESSYDPAKIPNKVLLNELMSLQKEIENRCITQELLFERTSQSFVEQRKKLNEQIDALQAKISKQESELREQIALVTEENALLRVNNSALENDLNQQIAFLNQENASLRIRENELGNKITFFTKENASFQTRSAALENQLQEQIAVNVNSLAYQENVFRNSARWRVGSVFVGGLRLILDFFKHPLKFLRDAKQRLYEYFREINPNPLSEKTERTKNQPATKGVSAYPPPKTYTITSNKVAASNRQGKISLGCIMDEFTYDCLRPEANLIPFRPDNWKETLETEKPRAIFVESAWHGNEGSWQYKVAKYEKNMGDELLHLLAWAKEKKVPSIFWNKEDPPHYERFIEKARYFDYLFTSDADCIPRYIEDVGHKRVFSLPFAAQPTIHNPVLQEPRKYNVCFSGTYYGASFLERKREMDLLLKPALDFGLHIYDRQYGMVGPSADQYKFPEHYQHAVKGRLDYSEMVKAYKKYKVCLNVNSVKTSPTMFSRRVFELMASGTVVISTYSRGIEELLGTDIVLFSESEEDTRRHLENLLGNENYWSKLSVRGIRKVMEAHTYSHRLNYVLELSKLGSLPSKWPFFTVISKVENLQKLENLRNSIIRQTYRNFKVVLVLDDKSGDQPLNRKKNLLVSLKENAIVMSLRSAFKGINVDCISRQHEISRYLEGDYVAIFNEKDYYGDNYLKDYALTTIYNNQCNFIGKRNHYTGEEKKGELWESGSEYIYVSKVPTATLAIKREKFKFQNLQDMLDAKWFESQNEDNLIFSLDRFNYVQLISLQNIFSGIVDEVNI